jgi:uncharacterized damage-inducible protein DinB
MMKKHFLLYLCLLGIHSVYGQLADSLRSQLIRDWQRAKAYTQEYLDAMPKEKYSLRPVDSIRSFSQQLLHLAQGNIGLMSNGTGATRLDWAARNLEQSPGAVQADSVQYFVMASYDFAIASLKAMDAAKLGERFKRGNFDLERFAWILKAFEHQTHHRGQATIYIRLAGIKPPNEKLF